MMDALDDRNDVRALLCLPKKRPNGLTMGSRSVVQHDNAAEGTSGVCPPDGVALHASVGPPTHS
jgi:hypothetical protein